MIVICGCSRGAEKCRSTCSIRDSSWLARLRRKIIDISLYSVDWAAVPATSRGARDRHADVPCLRHEDVPCLRPASTKSPAFVSTHARPGLRSSFKQVFNRCPYYLILDGMWWSAVKNHFSTGRDFSRTNCTSTSVVKEARIVEPYVSLHDLSTADAEISTRRSAGALAMRANGAMADMRWSTCSGCVRRTRL